MKTADALEFLASHPYLPEDSPQDVIDRFNEVRKHFIEYPDPRCIPLFLSSFGDHMGWGLFQICDDVFRAYSPETLWPSIEVGLKSPLKGTRWWAAHWAMEFPVPQLKDALLN